MDRSRFGGFLYQDHALTRVRHPSEINDGLMRKAREDRGTVKGGLKCRAARGDASSYLTQTSFRPLFTG